MITSIRIEGANKKSQNFEKPSREDCVRLLSTDLKTWIGCLVMESDDGWTLTMFSEDGKHQIGILRLDYHGFFAKNPDVLETSDVRVGIAWSEASEDEVVTQEDLVRTSLLEFFDTARPTSKLRWREVKVE